jgi:hypothetical protein
LLFHNLGSDTFVDVAFHAKADRIEDGRSLATADFDGDGRLDLLLQNFQKPVKLLMGQGAAGNWLRLRLEGRRCNRDAIGAQVFVEAGGTRQVAQVACGSGYLASSSAVLHFGLAAALSARRIEVRWPNGFRQEFTEVPANQRYLLREGDSRLTPDPAGNAASPPPFQTTGIPHQSRTEPSSGS